MGAAQEIAGTSVQPEIAKANVPIRDQHLPAVHLAAIGDMSTVSGASQQHTELDTFPNSAVIDKVAPPADMLKGKTVVSEEGSGPKNKNYCHKCCTKGHVMADCTPMLSYQICEGDDHVTAKCPQKRNLRPVAQIMPGERLDIKLILVCKRG